MPTQRRKFEQLEQIYRWEPLPLRRLGQTFFGAPCHRVVNELFCFERGSMQVGNLQKYPASWAGTCEERPQRACSRTASSLSYRFEFDGCFRTFCCVALCGLATCRHNGKGCRQDGRRNEQCCNRAMVAGAGPSDALVRTVRDFLHMHGLGHLPLHNPASLPNLFCFRGHERPPDGWKGSSTASTASAAAAGLPGPRINNAPADIGLVSEGTWATVLKEAWSWRPLRCAGHAQSAAFLLQPRHECSTALASLFSRTSSSPGAGRSNMRGVIESHT